MAQAGYYGIASRLLSLRSLFWHRVKHEQLQKSSDGLLLLSGGMNVEISVRKRKLPAMLSVLATCLWERVGRWPPFLPWRMRLSFFFFFFYLLSLCSDKTAIQYFYTWLLTSPPVQVWPLSHSMVVILRTFSRSCTQKSVLLLLLESKVCPLQTRTIRINYPTWPWWCSIFTVFTVQLNACANVHIM